MYRLCARAAKSNLRGYIPWQKMDALLFVDATSSFQQLERACTPDYLVPGGTPAKTFERVQKDAVNIFTNILQDAFIAV